MAANKYEGEVEITLDKRRILKLTWRGRALFSEHTGISVDTFFDRARKGGEAGELPRFDHLAALLWACLAHEDRMLTFDQASELFQHAGGEELNDVEKQIAVLRKLQEVYLLRLGVKPEDLKKEAGGSDVPPPKPTTSKDS